MSIVNLTEEAKQHMATMLKQHDKPAIRLGLKGGGCAGFQYGFDFSENENEDDSIFERDGIKVVIDDTSLDYLAGSEIDFVTEMVGSAFQVNNPNATAGCGCGASFSM